MGIANVFSLKYCLWFFGFFQSTLRPSMVKVAFFGVLGCIKEFANIVAFFIPLKLIMVLSNPDVLQLQVFFIEPIDVEQFILYSVLLFILLMFISFACHLILAKLVHKNALLLWKGKKVEFSSRTKYKNLYQLMVDTITHLLIITVGLACVVFLDVYLSVPILLTIVSFVFATLWLSQYSKSDILAAPFKSPRLVFKLLGDIGFSLTFVFIIIEYYYSNHMDFLYTLLAVLMSRIILRSLQQLFVKHRGLFDDHYQASV